MQAKKNLSAHGGKWIWGEGARDKKITVRMDTSPSLLGSSVNDCSVLAEKQRLNMDCNFPNSIFRLPPKTEKLRHVTDCNIVGEAKLMLIFNFSLHC